MSKFEKIKRNDRTFSSLDVSKILFFIFLLYMDWYKEIWGDMRIILYGTVIALTLSLLYPIKDDQQKQLEFDSITPCLAVFLVFGFYCLLSGIIVSIDKSLFFSSITSYFSFLIVLFDCCLITKREGNWDWLLDDFIMVAVVCLVYTIFFGAQRRNGGAAMTTLSTSNNPHTLAFVFLMGLFGVIGRERTDFRSLGIGIIIVLGLIYGILLTGSRKTLLSTILLLAVWIYGVINNQQVGFKQSRRGIMFSAIIAGMIIALWYYRHYYVGSDQYDRLLRLLTGGEDSANEARVQMYQLAWNIWKEHPIFGVGFNQYKLFSWRGDYSHSTYAEVFSCTGLAGSAILLIPLLKLSFHNIKYIVLGHNNYRYFYTVCFAGILVEWFLGFSQIWIYGFTHELFFLCIFGVLEYWIGHENRIKPDEGEVITRWKYLR